MTVVADVMAWLGEPSRWVGPNGIPARLFEHVAISATSLLIAVAIALPIGFFIGHTGRGSNLAVNAANIGRALPSLAAIALVYPITAAIDPQWGFFVAPTLVAMVVLAVPPILVNAYAGIQAVDRDLLESARGMGLRERQVLTRVELPIALPVIVGGIRSAAVQIVATATLGAIFGFGGLGRYLVDGVAQNDDGQIFGGVVLVAGLAIFTELGFGLLQRVLTSPGLRRKAERPGSRTTADRPA
jgi:osmoprotectant transport system permease protein